MKKELPDRIVYLNEQGQLHREDGPAVEYFDGTKVWFSNNKLHREDGPAIEWNHGGKEWFINDKRHREDGPSLIWNYGYITYHLNHIEYSEEQYKTELIKLKLNRIKDL